MGKCGKCGITSPKDAIITKVDPALFLKGFFDVNLGDDAEAFLLRASVVRRTASSKPTGCVLLK
jgi:hypothetical protein